MIRCKLRKYAIVLPLCAVFFISLCTYTYLRFYHYLNSDYSEKLSPKNIFYNVAGGDGDFITSGNVIGFYIILFVLFLFYIFTDENESYIVRLKSRASFVTGRIADCAVFAFLFSFLIEAVNVVAALICFDINLILELNFLQYSALELLTLFLFYFRAGLVMLSFGIIISPKVAPFITIALYLIELFATIIFMISKVWLPFRDSVVVSKLMHGEMVLSDMWGIILRALLMMFLLIFSSYFLYQKKDVLINVKK